MLLDSLADGGDFLRCGALGGQAGHFGLEKLACFQQAQQDRVLRDRQGLQRVLSQPRKGRDENAPALEHAQQPQAFQDPDGLAHGGDADADLGGERAHAGQLLARRVAPVDDAGLDVFQRGFIEQDAPFGHG